MPAYYVMLKIEADTDQEANQTAEAIADDAQAVIQSISTEAAYDESFDHEPFVYLGRLV